METLTSVVAFLVDGLPPDEPLYFGAGPVTHKNIRNHISFSKTRFEKSHAGYTLRCSSQRGPSPTWCWILRLCQQKGQIFCDWCSGKWPQLCARLASTSNLQLPASRGCLRLVVTPCLTLLLHLPSPRFKCRPLRVSRMKRPTNRFTMLADTLPMFIHSGPKHRHLVIFSSAQSICVTHEFRIRNRRGAL